MWSNRNDVQANCQLAQSWENHLARAGLGKDVYSLGPRHSTPSCVFLKRFLHKRWRNVLFFFLMFNIEFIDTEKSLKQLLKGKELEKVIWTIRLIKLKACLWKRKWQSTPVLSPGKSHGQRSRSYSPWGCKEPDMT